MTRTVGAILAGALAVSACSDWDTLACEAGDRSSCDGGLRDAGLGGGAGGGSSTGGGSGGGSSSLDAGSADAGRADAGSTDAGSTDAGSTDAGSTDAGSTDAGSTDAGSTDAGSTDAGSTDAGSTDAGSTDAGSTDAGGGVDGGADSGTGGGPAGGSGGAGGSAGGGSGGGGPSFTVISTTPPSARTAAGQTFTLIGTGLTSSTAVTVGGQTCAFMTTVGTSLLSCALPSLPFGPQSVAVTQSSMTITLTDAFFSTGSPALWLDAARSAAGWDGGLAPLAQWSDASGNNRHAAQITGSQQPWLAPGPDGGWPVVRFSAASATYLGASLAPVVSGSGARTVIIVERTPGSSNGLLFGFGNPPFAVHRLDAGVVVDNSGIASLSTGETYPSDVLASTSVTCPTAAALLQCLVRRNDVLEGYVFSGDGGAALATQNAGLFVGGRSSGSYFTGDIAEILLYSTELSTTELSQLHAYLARRYGL